MTKTFELTDEERDFIYAVLEDELGESKGSSDRYYNFVHQLWRKFRPGARED